MATDIRNGASLCHFILFVKVGRDDLGLSACPSCHHAHMLALEKVAGGSASLTVRLVNPSRLPSDARQVCRRLPALTMAEEPDDVAANCDEIPAFLNWQIPKPSFGSDDRKAVEAVLDVFFKFSYFLRSLTASYHPLEAELEKLDRHLSCSQSRYLCGDELSDLDFEFLPKLHQVRIASAALKHYEIPGRLLHVWRYLGEGYKLDSFKKSCPSDEEIIHHWGQKVSKAA